MNINIKWNRCLFWIHTTILHFISFHFRCFSSSTFEIISLVYVSLEIFNVIATAAAATLWWSSWVSMSLWQIFVGLYTISTAKHTFSRQRCIPMPEYRVFLFYYGFSSTFSYLLKEERKHCSAIKLRSKTTKQTTKSHSNRWIGKSEDIIRSRAHAR